MENKKNTKYFVILIALTFVFVISLLVLIFGFSSLSRYSNYNSLSGRIDRIEGDSSFYGSNHILSTLLMDRDYEKEFDVYWEYADAYQDYIRGRFTDNKDEAIKKLNEYKENCNNEQWRDNIDMYIEAVENSKKQ